MTCCLCGIEITGYGNNADPVKVGTCCDLCNATEVIPARLRLFKEHQQRADRKG